VKENCRRILNEAAHAWQREDFEALKRASEEVPTGFTLCVFQFKDGDPSFCILATSELQRFSKGFRCLDASELVTHSLPAEEQGTSTEPDRPSPTPGIQGSVDPLAQDGRGNL
jgi:hypothetical protein